MVSNVSSGVEETRLYCDVCIVTSDYRITLIERHPRSVNQVIIRTHVARATIGVKRFLD